MLTDTRVNELVDAAKHMSIEELQVVIATVGLGIAQDITMEYIREEPDEYMNGYAGVDLFEQASFIINDICLESELAAVVNQYKLGQRFDIEVKREIVVKPKG